MRGGGFHGCFLSVDMYEEIFVSTVPPPSPHKMEIGAPPPLLSHLLPAACNGNLQTIIVHGVRDQ
jgi:hypothetical protein